jgi:hypothetical protein
MFGNLSDIEVEIGMDEHGQPLHTPLFEHVIAAQLLTQPPASKLLVRSMEIIRIRNDYSRGINIEGLEDEDLLIETEDGSPITIGEFVAQVHEHLNNLKRIIIEFKCFQMYGTWNDERLAQMGVFKEDLKVYFERAASFDFETGLQFSVATLAEGE